MTIPKERMEAISQKARALGGIVVDFKTDEKSRILLQCKYGHEWRTQTANFLKNNNWCPYCSGRNSIHPLGHGGEIKDLIESKGGEMLSEYKGKDIKISVKCDKGHIWDVRPGKLKSCKCWCPYCAGQKAENDGFHKKLEEHVASRGGKLLTKYVNQLTKVLVDCGKGHSWKIKPGNLTALDRWCPKCFDGKNFTREPECRRILELLTGEKFVKTRPKWLKNPITGMRLELDGYCEELKIAFEHQGQQHLEQTNWYSNEASRFEKIKYRDAIKRQKCLEMGVKLIEIPYTIPFKDIKKFIESELKKP